MPGPDLVVITQNGTAGEIGSMVYFIDEGGAGKGPRRDSS